jgi:hypothetical protein
MVESFLYARETTTPMGLGGADGASSHNTVSPHGRTRFADGFKVIVQKRSDFSIGGKLLPQLRIQPSGPADFLFHSLIQHFLHEIHSPLNSSKIEE